MRRCLIVCIALIASVGCGEKDEVNPQVEQNPSAELQEKARAQGMGDAPAQPQSQSSD